MNKHRILFWSTTLMVFFCGLLWGMVIDTGLYAEILPAISFVVLSFLAFVLYTSLRVLLRSDLPLGYSGFLYLLGIMILGSSFTTANIAIFFFGVFILLGSGIVEYFTRR